MSDKPDNRCPLCGQENQCAIAAGKPPESCWCQAVTIAQPALDALPAGERGVRCICPECGIEKHEE